MYKKLPTLRKGFTLIELLVVIAIIGILAIVLIVALDPIEVINKTRDTGNVSDAKQINDAYVQFYTANQCYPWDFDATATPVCSGPTQAASGALASADFTEMVGQGVIKQEFATRVLANTDMNLSSTDPATGTFQTHVYFAPKSKAFKAKNLFDNSGDCSTAGAVNVCIPGTNF